MSLITISEQTIGQVTVQTVKAREDIVKLIFAETNYGASELHERIYAHLRSLQFKKCA